MNGDDHVFIQLKWRVSICKVRKLPKQSLLLWKVQPGFKGGCHVMELLLFVMELPLIFFPTSDLHKRFSFIGCDGFISSGWVLCGINSFFMASVWSLGPNTCRWTTPHCLTVLTLEWTGCTAAIVMIAGTPAPWSGWIGDYWPCLLPNLNGFSSLPHKQGHTFTRLPTFKTPSNTFNWCRWMWLTEFARGLFK